MDSPEEVSLLRNRNFILLVSGQFVSWVGTEFSGIAIPLIVLSLTGSPQQAGIIAGVRGLVYVVLAIPTGALIDRWDRKTVIIIGNLGSGIAIGSICLALLLHRLTITQLYIAGIAEGAFFVFANLSRFAAIQQIVPKQQLAAASARISVTDYTSLLLGPALGGILYQTVGAALAIFLDALSYLVNAVSVYFITVPLKVQRSGSASFRKEIMEGVRWLRGQKIIQFLNVLSAGDRMVTSGLYLLIIIIAKHNHASAGMIGLILGIGAGGGVMGSLVAEKIYHRLKFQTIIRLTMIFSLMAFLLYFFTFNNYLLAAVTFLFNITSPISEVTSATYSAHTIPNEIRGRVSSITRVFVLGSNSLGLLLMGTFLEKFGVSISIALFSAVYLFLSVCTLFNKSLATVL